MIEVRDREIGQRGGFPKPPPHDLIFFVFLIFFIILHCGIIFFIFKLISSFSLLISYFKLTCYFEVLSKPATSCSNLSLIVEGQGVPGHSTF